MATTSSSTRRSGDAAEQTTTTAPAGDGEQTTTTTARSGRSAKPVTNNLLADNGTRLDDFNDKPSTVQPGDAPADTKDPEEMASTVGGDKLAAAVAGHQTVNAAVPLDPDKFRKGLAISSDLGSNADSEGDGQSGGRWEEYDLTRPDGSTAHGRRNLDTGEHHVS